LQHYKSCKGPAGRNCPLKFCHHLKRWQKKKVGCTEFPRGGKKKCRLAMICHVMAAKFANLAKGGNVVARIYNAVAAKI